MPSEDFSDEVNIVGGIYQESCYCPEWNELFGSGWRAVRVLRSLCPKSRIVFHTIGDEKIEEALRVYAASENLDFKLTKAPSCIGFYYDHPLDTPIIHGLSPESYMLSVKGKRVIGFGMIEAKTHIEGEWVVYDPQSPSKPISFREQGGKAEHLALVLNEGEARVLSRETDIKRICKVLFEREKCECLVVKCGAKGAFVFTSSERDGIVIPVFKTQHVWPIGSGDIFTTVFASCWFSGCEVTTAAVNASKAVAVYCNHSGEIDIISDVLGAGETLEEFVPKQKGKVYLAGPFFTLSEKLFVSKCRNLLYAMGVSVFSPYHDVGEGKAEVVVPEDIKELERCTCVFAIVDGLDSGTLFEIGYAKALGKTVVAYVENETEGSLKMLEGTGCVIEKDFTTALYKTCWYAQE